MSEATNRKILLLGNRSTGKSFLTKRLEQIGSSNNEFLETNNTNGKQITTVVLKRKQQIEIHEISGNFLPVWRNLCRNLQFDKIIFVVDMTQPWSMSSNFQILREIEEENLLEPKNIFVALNKTEEKNSIGRTTLNELIDFRLLFNGNLDLLETDFRTGKNLERIVDFLTR